MSSFITHVWLLGKKRRVLMRWESQLNRVYWQEVGSRWLLKAADLPLNPWHTEWHVKKYHEGIKNPTAPALMNHFTFMFQCESLRGLTLSSFLNLTVIFEDLTIKIYTKKDTRWYFKSFSVESIAEYVFIYNISVKYEKARLLWSQICLFVVFQVTSLCPYFWMKVTSFCSSW